MRYLVSYDLTTKTKNYEAVDKEFKDNKTTFRKSFRALESQWVVNYTEGSAESLYEHLRNRNLVHRNDKVLVVCLDNNDWHSSNAVTKTTILTL